MKDQIAKLNEVLAQLKQTYESVGKPTESSVETLRFASRVSIAIRQIEAALMILEGDDK